jgi:mono/diheme cytochrome c family protein
MHRLLGACALLVSSALAGCGASTPAPQPEPSDVTPPPAAPTTAAPASAAPSTAPTAAAAPAAPGHDDGLGGRLYDAWYADKTFTPDNAKTPAADGKGGPFGNGTLPGADGKPVIDPHGHQTRLKNLFGWDLRGAQGVYGPKYQAKKYVLERNLLEAGSRDELARWLGQGDTGIPAYGKVLEDGELRALVDFVWAMREGKLPRPEQVFALREKSAGNYALVDGGDAERGRKMVAERCAQCHGKDGTEMLFDDGDFSLGSHARQKAYEDWMKILNGQPGTAMTRQVLGKDGPAMAREIVDILAALCDRKAFPRGKAKAADVPDGDPRCGKYLR